jgi:hypothetical protein
MKITITAEVSTVKIQVRIVIFKLIKIRIVDKTKIEHGRLESVKFIKRVSFKRINIMSMIKDLKEPIKKLFSKLRINLKLKLVYGLSSPDKTAISYGILNGLIYSLDLAINSAVKKYNGTYTIYPDMKKSSLNYNIEAKVSFRILTLMPSILKLLKIVFIQIRRKKRKEGMKDGRTSHRKLNENYNGQP